MNTSHPEFPQLRLSQQICFPLYAASRLVTRAYHPLLAKLGLTYPQYLVMLVLWEEHKLSVNQIGERLLLSTNTITPLLQRMETMGLLYRSKDTQDERRVLVHLSNQGAALQQQASCVPAQLFAHIQGNSPSAEELAQFQNMLYRIIHAFQHSQDQEN